MRILSTVITLLLITLIAGCSQEPPASLVGTLERDRVELSLESNEPILDITVEDGQAVQAGDLILRQDPQRLDRQWEQSSQQAERVRARLAELQRGPRPELIQAARARLTGEEASLKNARENLKRHQDIFDRGLSDQASYDNAQARFATTEASVMAARDELDQLLNGTTIEELQQVEAELAVAEAALRSVELNRERLELRAPVNGLLEKVWYEVGERPNPGATVAVILDDARVFARIYVPENLRAQVTPGKTLQVQVDGVSQPFAGTVRWVSSDASFTPYFALTEYDRSRLSYLAEVDLQGAEQLPSGVPLQVVWE